MSKLTVLALAVVSTLLWAGPTRAADQQWELAVYPYVDSNFSWWPVPTLGDLDGDGDFDLLAGNEHTISYYRNDGSPQLPSLTFVTGSYLGFTGSGCSAPTLADIDADGDLDLFVASCGSRMQFWRNDGSATQAVWTLVTEAFLDAQAGCSNILSFADMDADGDLDVFLGSCDWIAYYFENQGSATQPDLVLTVENWAFEAVGIKGYGNFVAPVDVDLDGDLDVLISNTHNQLAYIRNDGTPASPSWTLASDAFPELWNQYGYYKYYVFPRFVDIDSDGQDEVVMGAIDEGLYLFENVTPPGVTDPDVYVAGLADAAFSPPAPNRRAALRNKLAVALKMAEKRRTFLDSPPPSDEEVESLLCTVALRVAIWGESRCRSGGSRWAGA